MDNIINIDGFLGETIRNLINYAYQNRMLVIPDNLNNISDLKHNFFESELENLEVYINFDKLSLKVKNAKVDFTKNMNGEELQEKLDNIPIMKVLCVKYANMKTIDLTNIKKLNALSIDSDLFLEEVKDLNKNKGIKDLEFFGNTNYKDIDKMIDFSLDSNAMFIEMDALYYLDFKSVSKNIPQNIDFCESVGDGKKGFLRYTRSALDEVYEKAKEYNKYIMKNDTDKEKFAILYKLITQNVAYDYKYFDSKRDAKIKISGFNGGGNGMYNGFIAKKAVCEGYVHMLQLLLKMNGIKSYNTLCNTNNKSEGYNHAIISTDLGDGIQYSDITFDAGEENPQYFLLSRNDMRKNRMIDIKLPEKDADYSITEEEKNKLLSFANDRINQINLVKKLEGEIIEKFHVKYDLFDIDDVYKAKKHLMMLGRLNFFDKWIDVLLQHDTKEKEPKKIDNSEKIEHYKKLINTLHDDYDDIIDQLYDNEEPIDKETHRRIM